jgi:AraC-like DNA-binding protein
MNISPTSLLFALLIFQLLFLSFFLLTREKGSRVSNILLGCFFLSISLNLLDVFLLMAGVYTAYPAAAGWGTCLPLLFGPLLYFYTRSIVYTDFSVRWRNGVHLLPFLLLGGFTEVYWLLQPRNIQERLLTNLSDHHIPPAVAVVSTLIFALFLVYATAALRLVARYQRTAGQLFSDRRHTDVSWLYFTLTFFMAIMVIAALNGLLTRTSLAKYYLLAFNMLILALLVFISQVLLKTLRQPDFFSFSEEEGVEGGRVEKGVVGGVAGSGEEDLVGGAAPGSGRKDSLEKERIAQTVVQYMESHKPWLESELTLDQLATRLSLKPKVLSQVINEIRGQNFFDFINRYRIEEAMRLLAHPKDEKITVLEVLYEVGFNSKSSFNTLFKKYTGLTPTQFRKNKPDRLSAL